MSGLTAASRHSPEWPQPPRSHCAKRVPIASLIGGRGGRNGAQAPRSDIGVSRWKFLLKSEDASPRSGSWLPRFRLRFCARPYLTIISVATRASVCHRTDASVWHASAPSIFKWFTRDSAINHGHLNAPHFRRKPAGLFDLHFIGLGSERLKPQRQIRHFMLGASRRRSASPAPLRWMRPLAARAARAAGNPSS